MTTQQAPGARALAPAAAANRRARAFAGPPGDPRARLGLAMTVLLVTALLVHRDRVGPREAKAFAAINGLPDSCRLPAWAVMQFGSLGAVPVAAIAARMAGERTMAYRLLISGTGTWALAKLVKRVVRRPRPALLLPGTRNRGRAATGLGYLSGHAGVAAALGATAVPRFGPAGRALALTAVPLVGLARVYAGAHLPLDIAGGAALGVGVAAAADLASGNGRLLPGDQDR